MKEFPWEVVVLGAVLLGNRVLVPLTIRTPWAFWSLQAINGVLAVAVAVLGLPGLGSYGVLNWAIVALLAFHTFQNVALRRNTLDREALDVEERERIKRLRRLEAMPDVPESERAKPADEG